MRVLLLDGFDPAEADHRLVDVASAALNSKGHELDVLAVHGFNATMSEAERLAYHSEQPVISEDVSDSVTRVRAVDALLFCYPTVAFTVPESLKGWLERVLVPGVAFVFNDKHRLRPGMTNIRRVGALTTSPHDRWTRLRRRDSGKRTTARTLRLSAHRRCRTTFVSAPSPFDETGAARVRRALRRW
ncbi:MAG: NAD(P)H-dependent oxidoreductase [Acidimicrobiaceae bacterium]|nr:NAD(P)H-dependent oxidoreductase [Acidimicrobiaceae bacterium]MCY4176340.1 NAD(P)H-dependent oxidoreductase [Acidimicrobiaceae bacterium]MCY4280333.1 NAD(P)H-dependent oxidoreductase [Acidimicrobiaceae bacterium]MCY4294821.1 NAD(P)H-dependent oxidoreductase [Acidimicrobiaceae bacterium]